MPKIKNIIIFVVIAAIFVLLYIFFIKSSSPQASLISSPSSTLPDVNTSSNTNTNTSSENSVVTNDFVTLLLNVNHVRLDDTIFSDIAFKNLHDSSIVLTPDSTTGRPNPFAKLGSDIVTTPTVVAPVNSVAPPGSQVTPTTPLNTTGANNKLSQ